MIRLLFYSCMLAVLLFCVTVAHDIASSVARFEAQTAADAAALAGAATLMRGDSVAAAREAQDVARRNTVTGAPAELRIDDVSFNVPEGVVRVRVRGPAMPFRVPLLPSEVVAEAAAQARLGHLDRGITPRTLQLIE